MFCRKTIKNVAEQENSLTRSNLSIGNQRKGVNLLKAFRKMKIVVISLAVLLAVSGCSSNAVPSISPVKAVDQTQASSTPAPTVSPSSTPTPVATAAPKKVVAAPPVVTPAPAPKQAPQSVTVFITKTGAKYHRDGCRYLSKSRIPISLSDAKSGYTPCSVCNPPQ